MTINVELLTKTLDWATSEARKAARGEFSEWNQGEWICGSTCCIAGRVTLDLGWKPLDQSLAPGGSSAVVRGDERSAPLYVAEEALGLTIRQADSLFHYGNTITDLWRLAAEFTDGEIAAPPDVADGPLR